MSIDPLSSISTSSIADRNTSQVKHHQIAGNEKEPGVHTTLTAVSAAVSSVVAQAMTTLPIRKERVDTIKALIGTGSYSLDAKQVALSMLSRPLG